MYFLRYVGVPPAKPRGDVERIRRSEGVEMVDDGFPTMVIVRGDEQAVCSAVEGLSGWTAHADESFEMEGPPAF